VLEGGKESARAEERKMDSHLHDRGKRVVRWPYRRRLVVV
jgi:hypothetical protein